MYAKVISPSSCPLWISHRFPKVLDVAADRSVVKSFLVMLSVCSEVVQTLPKWRGAFARLTVGSWLRSVFKSCAAGIGWR